MSASATESGPIHSLARPLPGLALGERVGVAAEWVRVSPYRAVPVLSGEILVGMVTERSVAEYLLRFPEGPARQSCLEHEIAETVMVPTAALHPLLSVDALREALVAEGVDALPLTEGNGLYLGMIGHSDLVRELLRPLALPQLGGMATPVGVYLTTGAAHAGASPWALVLTGFCFFVGQFLLLGVLSVLTPSLPHLPLPMAWRETIELTVTALVVLAGFLGLIRLSPIAGYHAAEHQVVHSLERHVPLLPERVAQQPRVHPRCGTNLMAGSFLLGLGGAFSPLLGQFGFVFSGLLALVYWRSLGEWFQAHLTTRPASRAQLEQAIAAARELLVRHEQCLESPTPLRRLLYSGMPPLLAGFLLGAGLLALLCLLIPPLGAALRPHWEGLL